MYRSRQLTLAAIGIAALLGKAAPARSTTLTSGVLETSATTQIRCWLANASTQPLTYTTCSVNAFTGNEYICQSGVMNPGVAGLVIGGSNGGTFYCRFTVSSRSASRATASITSFNGTPFSVIDAR